LSYTISPISIPPKLNTTEAPNVGVEGTIKLKVEQHPNNFPPFPTAKIEMFIFAKLRAGLIVTFTRTLVT
jgi:hypothetical protein